MSKFLDKATEVGAVLGSQRHLASVRDGFISLMPLIMAGSVALIIKNIPIPNWQQILPGFVISLCDSIWWGTFAFLSVFAVYSIAYNLANSYGSDAFRAGFVALASYLALIPQVVSTTVGGIGVTAEMVGGSTEILELSGGMWGLINWTFTSANSLFMAIIVALVAGEIFIRFNSNDKLLIKLPSSVPPAVGKSFSVLIPAMLTIGIMSLLGIIVQSVTGNDIFTFVNNLFAPLVSASDSMISGILIVLLNQVFWMLGLHGSNIIGSVFEPISLKLMDVNIAAFQAGEAIPHIMTKPFLDAFVHLGGSGATIGLIVAIFFVSKSKLYRTMGKTCIAPGCFNINEPVLFGIPIVLNPLFAIPFVFGPILLTIISYLATYFGLVGRAVAIIPWATPPILSGWMATGGDFRACILQVINIIISIVIYIPFVRVADQLELKKEQQEKNVA